MAKAKEPINPFYLLLVAVGVVFLITAFAYGTMAWRATQPVRQTAGAMGVQADQKHPLMAFLDRHGIEALSWELAVLGGATVAAIGLDQRRQRLAEGARGCGPQPEDPPKIR